MSTPAAEHARAVALIGAAVGDLAAAETALVNVAGGSRAMRAKVIACLTQQPDYLINPPGDSAAVMVKLAHELAAQGFADVITLPSCRRCGRQRPDLNRRDDAGNLICGTCYAESRTGTCARCGRSNIRLTVRRGDGLICTRCYNTDPEVVQVCGGCGKNRRPVGRAADGSPRCQLCHGRPVHPCSICGRERPANAIAEAGSVCAACYKAPPRACGRCGEHRPIARRAHDDQPDLCYRCYQATQTAQCATCGKTRPCQRIGSGTPICQACRRRPPRSCFRCRKERPVQAEWPAGPVCVGCYEHIRRHPGPCPICAVSSPLIGTAPNGQAICGPCAGVDLTYTCRSCGSNGEIHRDRQCFRCVLKTDLTALLTDATSSVPSQLQPVLRAMASVDNPSSVLTWVRRSQTSKLLRTLVELQTPVTHELLDAQPQTKPLQYLRELLVTTGVLPARDEFLERLAPWIEQLLVGEPARISNIIRQYGQWWVIRRARQAPQSASGYRRGSSDHARTRVLVALELLRWLGARNLDLAQLRQQDLETWLDSQSSTQRTVRYFLKWAHKRRLCRDLLVVMPPRQDPAPAMTQEQHAEQLRRCLADETLPPDLRLAGALILLFGLLLTRVLSITRSDIIERDGNTLLLIDGHELLLPPRVAALVDALVHRTPPRSTLSRIPDQVPWLFPGQSPARPANDNSFAGRLKRANLAGLSGRNAARFILAAELPAAVIADLTGLHITTALRWSKVVQRDWSMIAAPAWRMTNIAGQE